MPSTISPPTPASRQAAEGPAPAPVPEQPPSHRAQPRVPRIWKTVLVFIVITLPISLGISAGFRLYPRSLPAARSATPTPTAMRSMATPLPTSTPVPSIYLTLTGTCSGTLFDVSVNLSTSMSLTGIRQNQGNISGYLALGPNIQGSGPFSGTIDTAGHFHFIVTDAAGNTKLFFEGVMQLATSLSGDYYRCSLIGPTQGGRCSQASGSYGIWAVAQT